MKARDGLRQCRCNCLKLISWQSWIWTWHGCWSSSIELACSALGNFCNWTERQWWARFRQIFLFYVFSRECSIIPARVGLSPCYTAIYEKSKCCCSQQLAGKFQILPREENPQVLLGYLHLHLKTPLVKHSDTIVTGTTREQFQRMHLV